MTLAQWVIPIIVFGQTGASPLYVAAEKGHVEACKILLDHQASVDLQMNVSNYSGKEFTDLALMLLLQ